VKHIMLIILSVCLVVSMVSNVNLKRQNRQLRSQMKALELQIVEKQRQLSGIENILGK